MRKIIVTITVITLILSVLSTGLIVVLSPSPSAPTVSGEAK
jgi:hypothetical protein